MIANNLLKKVKELREITGVGFKDCKSAIEEAKGDIKKAIELLRIKGIAKASQRMERIAPGRNMVIGSLGPCGTSASLKRSYERPDHRS